MSVRANAVMIGISLAVLTACVGQHDLVSPSGAQAPELVEAGVPEGVDLQPSGNVTVTEDGVVVEGLDIDGRIWIKANDVTIRDTRVTHAGWHVIRIFPGYAGTVVEDVTVECGDDTRSKAIVFGGYTARRVEANGCVTPFVVVGGNVIIEDSVADGEPVGIASGRPWWCAGYWSRLVPDALCPGPGEPTTTDTRTSATSIAPPAATTTTAAPAATTTTAGAAPTTTAPTTSGPAPLPAGVPSAATTGYNACGRSTGALQPMSGTIELGAGEVLENFDLTGQVTVSGSGAVIRCGRIRTSAHYGITNPTSGGASFLVEDVQIVGTSSSIDSNSAALSPYGGWTARRIDVSRFRDGVKLGSNQTIESSWIHDLWATPGAHNDGLQSVGGTNVTVRGNNIEANWRQQTSAMMLGADLSPITNHVITGNRFSGGGYTIYIGGKEGKPTPQGITFTNNVIVDGSFAHGPFSLRLNWPAGDSRRVISDNTLSSGAALSVP